MRVVAGGMLALLLLAAVLLMSVDVQARGSTLTVRSVPTVQPTPTEDATVTALNKQKLVEDVEQQQHTLGNWLWSNAAALLSSLVLAIAGVFTLFRYLRDQRSERERQREDRQAELEKRAEERERQREDRQAELEKRAEERFQSAVAGLGDEKEGAQIGAAILLRTFLRSGYEQFYTQTFDLAVANLRRRGGSKIVQYQLWDAPQNWLFRTLHAISTIVQNFFVGDWLSKRVQKSQPTTNAQFSTQSAEEPQNPDTTSPLTTLDQALIVVFKEAFPLVRDQEKREPASLNATGIQLDNAYLVKADLKQVWGPRVSLRKANLEDANLEDANLSWANLEDANLKRANLSNANLEGADLSRANFRGANLSGTNLTYVNLSEADLEDADLSGANFTRWFAVTPGPGGVDLVGDKRTRTGGANLTRTNLKDANLKDANLRFADLSGAYLRSTDLTRADLRHANLSEAYLGWANFSGAKLLFAGLSNANLEGADLSRADFRFADLSGTNFIKANLSGADLEGADLEGANFNFANLEGADLSRTKIEGKSLFMANLRGTKGLTKEQLQLAGYEDEKED